MGDIEREKCAFRAKLAEEAERYDDMVEEVQYIAKQSGQNELSIEERHLLSVAYKNVIGARRASWRILTSVQQKNEAKGKTENIAEIIQYRSKIEKELMDVCVNILNLLDNHLIPTAKKGESQVFYMKMKGDYHRYLAEITNDDERRRQAENTFKTYKAAQEIAKTELVSAHPVRLGLALNFAVFYYEIENSSEKACDLAKQAFDEAIVELEDLPDDAYEDSTVILQLLKDNLSLWMSETKSRSSGSKGARVAGPFHC